MRKLFQLRARERRLVMQALVAVSVARALLLVLPLRTVCQLVRRLFGSEPLAPAGCSSAQAIVWAVSAAARRSPTGSTCLANALVGQAMLRRHGHHSELRIGVRRNADRAFAAHAWLEIDGSILMGGPASVIGLYAALPDLEHLIQ